MKNEKLTTDEYDALGHIERGAAHDRVNACVGRNAKRLSGLKMIQYAKDGRVALTEKGQQALFLPPSSARNRTWCRAPKAGST
jgi:predicted RNA-binding Zn ribbon-like protein